MQKYYYIFIRIFFSTISFYSLVILLLFNGCNSVEVNDKNKKVYISKAGEKYSIYANKKVLTIKGAGGSTHLNTLKEMGGNTIRIWDTTNLATVLDSANAHKIYVVVGLPVINSDDDQSYYNDPVKVKKQFTAFKSVVNKFKNNPAILMWCVGNELSFPYALSYYNFYKAFNEITEMIHQDDPDHPVTTTVLNVNTKHIFNIVTRCSVDIISFNVFGKIKTFKQDLAESDWFWKGPYLITEWGIDGPWSGTNHTVWNAYIEDTSEKKAEIYIDRYKKYMPFNDPRFLGDFVFYWGNKQEITKSWFSMFDELGNKSKAINSMNYIWIGRIDSARHPEINYMLINKKGAYDNVILNSNQKTHAELNMNTGTEDIKIIKWEIYNEDWYLNNNKRASNKKLQAVDSLVVKNKNLFTTFTSPAKEGPYRLFATVYDGKGTISTCNTPFYVVSDK